VALVPDKKQGYLLVDPVQQTQEPVTQKTAQLLKPVAYTFHRPFPERALKVVDVLRFGLRHTMPDLFTIVLMGACGGLLSLLTPIGTGMIFDTIIPGVERGQLLQLTLALWRRGYRLVHSTCSNASS
jgi:ATP-binding cassette subfamily C protein